VGPCGAHPPHWLTHIWVTLETARSPSMVACVLPANAWCTAGVLRLEAAVDVRCSGSADIRIDLRRRMASVAAPTTDYVSGTLKPVAGVEISPTPQ
jgi:hypothetical protein